MIQTKPMGVVSTIYRSLRARSLLSGKLQCRAYAQSADGAQILQEPSSWDAYPDDIQRIAVYAEHARAHNYQIPLLSKAYPELDQTKAYHVAAAIRALRENTNGEVVVGRKIGFTNRSIWPQYGINASNWSYMYRNTVMEHPDFSSVAPGKAIIANIAHFSALEPKIEPEIVFGLSRAVSPTMSDAQILQSIEWMAHGYEIVVSIFPGWKFSVADTTAAFAMHGLYILGPKTPMLENSANVLEQLETFTIDIYRNGVRVDQGGGANVLGSPIKALRHLTELLEEDEFNPALQAGEIVTTGTLTKALDIQHGDVWSTALNGIQLPGLKIAFRTQ